MDFVFLLNIYIIYSFLFNTIKMRISKVSPFLDYTPPLGQLVSFVD